MSTSQLMQSGSTGLVLKALENPDYVWRTVEGIESETKLSRGEVLVALDGLPEDVLVESRKAKGVRVFSTRDHYRRTQSFLGKLLSAISDKAL
jgi:DNA-binding transcriptional regulator GbsR (MarR family)